ncbi:hypothetical protein NL676_000771 [Syzygium grande]|nr:hypothetical protein NL676_000771 [Syzygium grande]
MSGGIYTSGFSGIGHAAEEVRIQVQLPLVQVSLIGLVCFCCPGMYNALIGMGGSGQVDPTVANNVNTALYATFAIFGILGGRIYNVLGPRLTLASVVALMLSVQALSCFLWAGEGAIMTSYPPHDRKGIYISLLWSIYSMGGVIGGLIPFFMNYNRSEAGSVNDATYIGFMCFMTVGALLSLAILPPSKVIRDDGTSCTKVEYSSVSTEATEILRLFLNWKMLLIAPAAWAGNFFYQFTNVNGVLFNLRTKGLNSVFYWVALTLGSFGIGYVLDFSPSSRKMSGYVGIAIVALLGTALKYSRQDLPEKLDFKDSGSEYAWPFLLYLSYGLLDAMFQTLAYWFTGCLADDSETLSRSAGEAVAWQFDTCKVPFLSELIVNWSLMTVCYPSLLVLVKLAVKDDEEVEEGAEKEVASSFAH